MANAVAAGKARMADRIRRFTSDLRRGSTDARRVTRKRWRGQLRRPDGHGGAEGDRTPDLLIANEALSQLSYGPVRRGPDYGWGLRSCQARATCAPERRSLGSRRGTATPVAAWRCHRLVGFSIRS